jgi:hypothetical protein
MLHTHDLADNVFVRLATTKPHSNHTPLENFCTEALVACLRNSEGFQQAFVELCATCLGTAWPEALTEISTQVVPPTLPRSADTTPSSVRKGLRFDIEIRVAAPANFRIVIESKVDAAVDPQQLKAYADCLKQNSEPSGNVLLLVSSAKRIPLAARSVRKILWEQVYECAEKAAAGKNSKEAEATFGELLTQQFSRFLYSKGLSSINMPKLSSSELSGFPGAMRFLSVFEVLLKKLKSSGELKASRKIPGIESDENRSLVWFGIHMTEPGYKDAWIGMEFNYKTRAVCLVCSAIVPDGTSTTLGIEFPGICKFIPAQNDTWVEVSQAFEQSYNGSEKEISDWIKKAVSALRAFSKNLRKKPSATHKA